MQCMGYIMRSTVSTNYVFPTKFFLKFNNLWVTFCRFTRTCAKMKYILVTGGVISGVGKGVIASSIGLILKDKGIRVTAIKIDPYINIDAGTFSPYEHGEVFVLNDGAEVDLDLGNYERFLSVQLFNENNITTGKIYSSVINEERSGMYLGKTVQVIPHITNAIQTWIKRVAQVPVDGTNETPDVCIIELGGTVGDIEVMPFVEALSHLAVNELKSEDFMNIHVSYILEPKSTGEQKTKPTQASARELRRLGLTPDLIVCRSDNVISEVAKRKISNFCHIPLKNVIGVHDVSSIYEVPFLLHRQGVWEYTSQKLQLPHPEPRADLHDLETIIARMKLSVDVVRIVMIRKYVKIKDAYTSVIEALKHAALSCNKRLDLQFLDSSHLEPVKGKQSAESYPKTDEEKEDHVTPEQSTAAWKLLSTADGVLVPGGFGQRGIEGKILACKYCRENNVPFLGICLGMQCAVIDFARSVLALAGANSTEFDKNTDHPVVIEMPEHNTGKMGGTMRLGLRRTYFKPGESLIKSLYTNIKKDESNREFVEERHRHRYEVNPDYVSDFEKKGLRFVSTDSEGKRMEIIEHTDHDYFVGVQYHPEYISRPTKPSPPYVGLLQAASKRSLLSAAAKSNHVAQVCCEIKTK